jgi:alpha/beta superfamily hydrolase
METPEFITARNKELFLMSYTPDSNNNKRIGIIICDPIFEEKLWVQRVMVNFSRYLMSKNYYIFRFDYSGHGDSTGHYKENTLDSYIEDVNDICDSVSKKYSLDSIYLLGLRFGTFIASYVANQRNDLKGLILLEPIIEADNYVSEILRSNLTSQLVLYKKIKYSRDILLDQLIAGEIVDIDGYEFTSEFYKSIASKSLLDEDNIYNCPVLVGRVVRNLKKKVDKIIDVFKEKIEEQNSKMDLITIIEEPFWNEVRKINTKPVDMFEKIEYWLKKMEKNNEN